MLRFNHIIFAVAICLIAADFLQAQQAVVHTSRDTLRAGDTFELSIVHRFNPDADDVIFPDSASFDDPFEVRRIQRFRQSANRDSLAVSLQFFGTEDTLISGLQILEITDQDTAITSVHPVQIYFRSTLDEEAQLRPLKPIFDFAASLLPWIIGALVLAILIWLIYRYREKIFPPKPEPVEEKQVEIPVFKNPLQEMESEIKKLRKDYEKGSADTKELYSRGTDIIRAYFEEVYQFPALEETSREVIADLEKRSSSPELEGLTKRILTDADMVKFAKFTPDEKSRSAFIDTLLNFRDAARTTDYSRIRMLQARFEKKHQINQNPEDV